MASNKSETTPMKVNDLVEHFTIDPIKDIEPFFSKDKELDLDAHRHKGCFNCDDKNNQQILKSTPWTGVQHCWACKHLNVIYYQDRMGGIYTDTIHCYGDKL